MGRNYDLDKSLEKLSEFYGIASPSEFLDRLSYMNAIDADRQPDDPPADLSSFSASSSGENGTPEEHFVGKFLLDVHDGGLFIKDVIEKLKELASGANAGTAITEASDRSLIMDSDLDHLFGVADIFYEPSVFAGGLVGNDDEATPCLSVRHGAAINEVGGNVYINNFADGEPGNESQQPGGLNNKFASVIGMIRGAPTSSEVWDRDGVQTINSSPTDPSKSAPSLCAILIRPSRLTYAVRDSGATQYFLENVPTLELSKCVPCLNVNIVSKFKPRAVGTNRAQGISMFRFLQGSTAAPDGSEDAYFIDALPVYGTGENINQIMGFDADSQIQVAGMELFTSPQTLVNADEPNYSAFVTPNGATAAAAGGPRAAPIIDPFRPFMTIESLELTVTPAGGAMAHKSGTLNIIVHDRSRLSEVAGLVKPSLYSSTHLLIEYGWNHPEGSAASENPMGQFINSLKMTEKFQVTNSSFSFQDDGQVKIVINLSMMGTINVDTSSIHEDESVVRQQTRMSDMLEAIRRYGRTMSTPSSTGDSSSSSSDVSGNTWLASMSSVRGAMTISTDNLEKLRTFQNALRATVEDTTTAVSADARNALAAIDEIFGTPAVGRRGQRGHQPAREGSRQSLAQIIDTSLGKKLSLIYDYKSGDPFHRRIIRSGTGRIVPNEPGSSNATYTVRSIEKAACIRSQRDMAGAGATGWTVTDLRTGDNTPWNAGRDRRGADRHNDDYFQDTDPHYVSLGKLMMLFVGQPLAATGNFDEVQLIFYPFNHYASYVRDHNIAEFPINARLFQLEIRELMKASTTISLRQFLAFLIEKFMRDPAADAWGLNDLYHINRELNRELRVNDMDATILAERRNQRLADAYTPGDGSSAPVQDLIFRQPNIGMSLEAIPAVYPPGHDNAGRPQPGKTILKVHIYDRQCTKYLGQQEMLNASRDNRLNQINSSARELSASETPARSTHRQNVAAVLQQAIDAGLLEIVPPVAGASAGDRLADLSSNPANPDAYLRLKGGFHQMKQFIKRTMPSVTYGSMNSAILSATVASNNSSELSSIQMLRRNNAAARDSSRALDQGLPVSVSPVSLSAETIGFPFFRFTQQLFWDFGTGTTIDNIYSITGITHTISPGEFKSKLSFVQSDGLSKYESTLNHVERVLNETR